MNISSTQHLAAAGTQRKLFDVTMLFRAIETKTAQHTTEKSKRRAFRIIDLRCSHGMACHGTFGAVRHHGAQCVLCVYLLCSMFLYMLRRSMPSQPAF